LRCTGKFQILPETHHDWSRKADASYSSILKLSGRYYVKLPDDKIELGYFLASD